ncbi:MAG: hypothetical protein L6Q57_09735 [Alphaproteobacteria bacterium]|nr:hypothetical protein [Alphaproteobacteria bacterium]
MNNRAWTFLIVLLVIAVALLLLIDREPTTRSERLEDSISDIGNSANDGLEELGEEIEDEIDDHTDDRR